MDTSSDTKKKQKKKQLWLPDTLRGKKLQKSRFPSDKEADCEKYLEQYLDTGEIDLLCKALQIDSSLFQGVAYKIDLKAEEAKRKRSPNYKSAIDSIYIDRLVIVGEVIRSLQAKCVFRFGEVIKTPQGKRVYRVDRKVTEGARRYLKKISPLLVPNREVWERIGKAGLIHRKPYQMKGGTSSFSYPSAPIFIQYWNSIIDAVTKSKKNKRRYNKQDRALLIKRIAEGLRKYLDTSICPFPEEIEHFNFKTTRLITASFISWRHKLSCPMCKRRKKDLSPETVDGLYKRAKEELKESQ